MRVTHVGSAALGIFLMSCAMGAPHFVSVGLTNLSYVKDGGGEPTVIFETGMGNDYTVWKSVFQATAATTTAFAYNRPGYTRGAFFRRESDGRRSADDVARMLEKILDRTETAPPYVLVGHSIGGAYALRYAVLHPDQVAGVVLVDARLKRFSEECEAADFSLCTPPGIAALAMDDHVREEFRGIEETEKQAPEPSELGDVLVTVIAATDPPFYASDELQELWLRVQREFAEGLENGRFVRAEGSGHFVQRDDPELVIAEIRDMVERVRESRPRVVAGLRR